jgi:NifB/MoaA-like Fe-S oxidoreductase
VQVQVSGDACPHEIDDRPAAVVAVDTGPAGLDEDVAQIRETRKVELAIRVEPADLGGPVRRQHPVGADDLARAVLADQEVIAVVIERVNIQTGDRSVQPGTHLLGEDKVPQALRRRDLRRRAGDDDAVVRSGRHRTGGGQDLRCGHVRRSTGSPCRNGGLSPSVSCQSSERAVQPVRSTG